MAPGEFQPQEIGFAGVPGTAATDLARGGGLQGLRSGVYALDRAWGPDDGGGSLHRVEASLGLGQAPRLLGTGGRGLSDALRLSWHVLQRMRRELGLGGVWQEGLVPAVSVEGELRDAESAALPLFLAGYEAARRRAWRGIVVACGGLSLSGRIEAPHDLQDRLGALPEVTSGTLVTGPLPVSDHREATLRIAQGWEVVVAGSLSDLLALERREGEERAPGTLRTGPKRDA